MGGGPPEKLVRSPVSLGRDTRDTTFYDAGGLGGSPALPFEGPEGMMRSATSIDAMPFRSETLTVAAGPQPGRWTGTMGVSGDRGGRRGVLHLSHLRGARLSGRNRWYIPPGVQRGDATVIGG